MTEVSIPPGVMHGATPASNPGRWYVSNMIRFAGGNGLLQPIGGWLRLTKTPLAAPIRRLKSIKSNADLKYVFAATETGLLVLDGDTWTDITPTGFVATGAGTLADGYGTDVYGIDGALSAYGLHRSSGTPTYLRGYAYSMDTWGEQLIFNSSSDGKIYVWLPSTPTTKAAVIATAPTAIRCVITTPERHIMAFGGGGTNARRVQWCSREDYTDWSYASTTNTAGFLDLDSESMIVAAAEVREGSLVLCDESCWLINWIGGDFIYGRQRIGSTTLLAPATIATFGGRAAWMTRSGTFILYDAGQIKPLSCDLDAFIAADMDPTASVLKAFASEQTLHDEVWFWYVSKTATTGECDRAVVWNTSNNTWAMHTTLVRTAMLSAGAHKYPLLAGQDNHLYDHERGSLDGNNSRVGTIYAETNAITPGGQARVQRMQMDGNVVNQSRVTITARDTRDGSDLVYGPFVPNPDGRTPIRAGGQELRLKIEATTDDPTWSIGRVIADAVPIGAR